MNSNICEDGYAKDAHAFGVLAEYLLGYMDSLGGWYNTCHTYGYIHIYHLYM